MPEPSKSRPTLPAAKAVGLCFGFGISLAAEIYIIGILAGGWLDEKLNSSPWCMLIGVLLAIIAAFWQLLRGLDYWREREDKQS